MPIRYAVMVKVGAAVETNRSKLSPCSTLVRLTKPRTLFQVDSTWGTSQASVPSFLISSAINVRFGAGLVEVVALPDELPVPASVPAPPADALDPSSSLDRKRSMPQTAPATGTAANAASTER